MRKYPRVGKYKVINAEKYVGNLHEVKHRSSWEHKYMKYLDNNSSVLEWASENVVIPYYNPIENRSRRYYVDFYVKVATKRGTIEKYIIEIKPSNQCNPPLKPRRQSQKYKTAMKTYIVNQSKWKAARKYAERRGWEFLVITEKHLGIK